MANETGSSVKRLAFCSAICAGFAYVGYKMVVSIVGKKSYPEMKNGLNDDKILLSLSKSVQTDTVLLCNSPVIISDFSDVRKSVKERVKDLNFHAQQFRKNSMQFSPEFKPQSPQSNPWSSPHILGTAKYLSYSAENVSSTSPIASPEHRRSKSPVIQGIIRRDCSQGLNRPDCYKAHERVTIRDPEIMLKTLNNVHKSPRNMTSFEVKNIISLMHSSDENILVKVLSTISNCAAFKTNQENLCDAGCIEILEDLLHHKSEPVKVAAVQAVSNLAVVDRSHRIFKPHIPILMKYAIHGGELLKTLSLTALANLALDDCNHKLMVENIGDILHLLEIGSNMVQLQALRLLVNISCNKEMIPFLLISKVSFGLFNFINSPADREITLRLLTFLANIVTFAAQDLDFSCDNSHTLISILYRLKQRTELECIANLSNDVDEDISTQAKRLYDSLVNKWS